MNPNFVIKSIAKFGINNTYFKLLDFGYIHWNIKLKNDMVYKVPNPAKTT